jgi:hypothetical protein
MRWMWLATLVACGSKDEGGDTATDPWTCPAGDYEIAQMNCGDAPVDEAAFASEYEALTLTMTEEGDACVATVSLIGSCTATEVWEIDDGAVSGVYGICDQSGTSACYSVGNYQYQNGLPGPCVDRDPASPHGTAHDDEGTLTIEAAAGELSTLWYACSDEPMTLVFTPIQG